MKPSNRNLHLLLSTLLFTVALSGCEFIPECGECFTPPEPLSFRVMHASDSIDLLYSGYYNPDSLAIYYTVKGKQFQVTSQVSVDSSSQQVIVMSQDISFLSLEGQHNFELYFSASDSDALYFKVIFLTRNCCTYHPFDRVEINENPLVHAPGEYHLQYFKNPN